MTDGEACVWSHGTATPEDAPGWAHPMEYSSTPCSRVAQERGSLKNSQILPGTGWQGAGGQWALHPPSAQLRWLNVNYMLVWVLQPTLMTFFQSSMTFLCAAWLAARMMCIMSPVLSVGNVLEITLSDLSTRNSYRCPQYLILLYPQAQQPCNWFTQFHFPLWLQGNWGQTSGPQCKKLVIVAWVLGSCQAPFCVFNLSFPSLSLFFSSLLFLIFQSF